MEDVPTDFSSNANRVGDLNKKQSHGFFKLNLNLLAPPNDCAWSF